MKKSLWQKDELKTKYSSLTQDDHVDVAIIGGGICGITSAALLKDHGLTIAVYEGSTLAASNTGKSTGNLYMLVDTPLQELSKKYELAAISQILAARREAIELIEKLIKDFSINCSFKRVPWTLYSAVEEMDQFVEDEYQLAKKLELPVERLTADNSCMKFLKARGGFQVNHQAQFDPYAYVNQMAQKITSAHCKIYENTRIEKIQEDERGILLKTSKGLIHAKTVIHATHTPLGFSPLQTVVAPYREYGIANKLNTTEFHDAIYWGYYSGQKLYSFRKHIKNHENYLLMIGSPHKVGQTDESKCIETLHHDLDRLDLPLNKDQSIEWSGQHFRSSDELPFIGEGFTKNTFLCTGFATDGLVYGTVSAMIFRDIILNKKNSYQHLFKPHRISSISTKKFVSENLNVLEQYVVDYFRASEATHPEKGQGTILTYKGHKYAVSKDQQGELSICSAVCTHLGCIVHWNNAESSWDCPCHGSRFSSSGKTLEGPAFKDLAEEKRVDL